MTSQGTRIHKDRNMAMTYTVISRFKTPQRYTSNSVMALCGVSRATAKRYLQKLEAMGLIKRDGVICRPVPTRFMTEGEKQTRKAVLEYAEPHCVKTFARAKEVIRQLSYLEEEVS